MSRRYYKLTHEGYKALKQARKVHDALWKGLKDFSLEAG
jgi:hypothetical protein